MADEKDKPGTFAWAMAQVDKSKEAQKVARAEYEAQRAAERAEEERKANPDNLTHEEAIEEVKRLRVSIGELQDEIEDLESRLRNARSALGRDPEDW